MSRILVIDKCLSCTFCSSTAGELLICRHPKFKSIDGEVFFGTRIHPRCPLPQGNYGVSEKDKIELVNYAIGWALEYNEEDIDRFDAMFHPVTETAE